MKGRIAHCGLLLLALLFTVAPVRAGEIEQRSEIKKQVWTLLYKQDFAALEGMAQAYRDTSPRTGSGIWKLSQFYLGVAWKFDTAKRDPEFWAKAEETAAAWTRQYPDSPTAHLARAQVLLNRGWSYHGPGFAASVKEADWAPYLDYTEKARRYLLEHRDIASRDPYWYELLVLVATRQKWPAKDFWAIVEEGTSRYPDFHHLYFTAANYLLPKWNGDAQSLEKLAQLAISKSRRIEGEGLYARIYWVVSLDQYGRDLFTHSQVDWPTMSRGIDDVLARYPDEWNVQSFAYFACLAGDKAKTAELLAKMHSPPEWRAWRNVDNHAGCSRWASEPAPRRRGTVQRG